MSGQEVGPVKIRMCRQTCCVSIFVHCCFGTVPRTHVILEKQWPRGRVQDWTRLLWLDGVLIGSLLLSRDGDVSQNGSHGMQWCRASDRVLRALPAANRLSQRRPQTFASRGIPNFRTCHSVRSRAKQAIKIAFSASCRSRDPSGRSQRREDDPRRKPFCSTSQEAATLRPEIRALRQSFAGRNASSGEQGSSSRRAPLTRGIDLLLLILLPNVTGRVTV